MYKDQARLDALKKIKRENFALFRSVAAYSNEFPSLINKEIMDEIVEGVSGFCFEAGYKSYYECEDCGYFEDENCTIAILDIDHWKQTDGKVLLDHIFTKKIEDKAHLVIGTGINCLDAVRYYYGCADCDAISTEEWTSDNYGEHKIDIGFTSSKNQHYHVCL